MITLLYNKFNETNRGGMVEMSDLERIDILLTEAEKAGMLPPRVEFTLKSNGKLDGLKYQDNAWEKE